MAENKQLDALIFTLSDSLEQIDFLVEKLPNIHFTIAAPVYFSERLQELGKKDNVSLETIFDDIKVNFLIEKSDIFLDINEGIELYEVISKFKAMGKPVYAFENRKHQDDVISFSNEEPEKMVEAIQQTEVNYVQNDYHKIWFDGDFNVSNISSNARVVIGSNVIGRSFSSFVVSGRLYLGTNVFFNNYCSFNCLNKIEIGEDTMMGEGVRFYDHDHNYTAHSIDKWSFKSSPIVIGKACWIGSNVTFLKGVTVGNNVIIGAGCTIRKDIPDNLVNPY